MNTATMTYKNTKIGESKKAAKKSLLKRFADYLAENIDFIAPGVIMMNGGYYRPYNNYKTR